MRATIHNGRTSNLGAFTPKHNDRNFNINHAEHINPERVKLNRYWNWTGNPETTFEAAEIAFYEKHISAHLEAQNARYRAQRHAERVRSMDEYRKSPQTCPEEVILQIGKMGDTIPADMMARIIQEQINWEQQQFPGVKVLDVALHMDEQGAPHIHERRAWVYTDKDGNLAISQNKALEQMGIELPNPDRPRGRFNNRKQTFSKRCREHLLQICREHGLEIEEIPQEKSKSGRTLEDYQAGEAEKRAADAERRRQFSERAAERTCAALEDKSRQYRQGIEQAGEQMDNLQSDLLEISHQVYTERQTLKDLQAEVEQLGLQCQDARRELKTLTKSTEKEKRRLQAIKDTKEQAASELREYKQELDAYKAECRDNLQELKDYMTEAQYNRAWYLSREDEWPEH